MKDFILGFSVCLCLGLLTALTQVRNTYKEESDIIAEYKNIFLNVQDKHFSVRTSTPILSDLSQGEIIITDVGGVQHFFTRIGNKLYKDLLTEN
jgi:hypothetical protein